MLHKSLFSALVFVLMILPGSSAGHAAPGPATNDKAPFVRGQVLVRFKSDASLKTATSLVASYGVTPTYRIADRTFILSVPEGQEAVLVKVLASEPAVQYASLNYWITEPPIAPSEATAKEALTEAGMAPGQEPPSCITDLWMSATSRGGPLLDNMLSLSTSEVYVVFEYADCDHEEVRIQVFYFDVGSQPPPIFDKADLVLISPSASGEIRVRVPAESYFAETGTFPVGMYLTILSVSPEGGWDPAREAWWHVSTFPDDYWFRGTSNYQWSLHSTANRALPEADINMPQAWDITTGSPEIIIANISSGVWLDHPDLKNKIWVNRNEIPGNGIDDDENGCVDDIHGCEFNAGEAIPDPNDLSIGLGTLSSGIAAAETNNKIGIAGISWGARILPIKVVRWQDGKIKGPLSNLIQAIDYAVANGARIIHIGPRLVNPEQHPGDLELLRAVIDDAVRRGALVVAGTGGDVRNPSPEDENRAKGNVTYPAGFKSVVAVGATDPNNQRAQGSNYWSGIDLVAPGKWVFGPYFEPWLYISASETNMAAAHVEGVAALIWSVNPNLSPNEVRTILQRSAVDLGPPRYDEEHGYGKLDAARALAQTPHHLWVTTTDLNNPFALPFLVDGQVNRACQSVWNWGTGPLTWALQSDSDWFVVERPIQPASAPVPSGIRVCVDAGSLPAYGTFEATLKARSTLTHNNGPVDIAVNIIYQPNLWRARLSLIRLD